MKKLTIEKIDSYIKNLEDKKLEFLEIGENLRPTDIDYINSLGYSVVEFNEELDSKFLLAHSNPDIEKFKKQLLKNNLKIKIIYSICFGISLISSLFFKDLFLVSPSLIFIVILGFLLFIIWIIFTPNLKGAKLIFKDNHYVFLR